MKPIYAAFLVCVFFYISLAFYLIKQHKTNLTHSTRDNIGLKFVQNKTNESKYGSISTTRRQFKSSTPISKKLTDSTTKKPKPLQNQFDYKFILKPNASFCSSKNLLLISFVLIPPSNFTERDVIRSTWAASHRLVGGSKNNTGWFRVVFMLGLSLDKEINKAAQDESVKYGDIVQASFVDDYYNLTLKTVMGLRWVATYCPNAKFILKVDGDVLVNVKGLINFLNETYSNKTNRNTNTIMGHYYNQSKVYRNETHKWYLSEKEYPYEFFEPYCAGSAYLLTIDLALKMWKLALQTPIFKFEDVFIGVILV
jgi:hypothetical protein